MHTKNEVIAAVKDLWSRVLDADELAVDIDFFAAGGSSLKSLILLTKLNDTFATEFEIAELVDCRTIDRQSEAVWNRITRATTSREERTAVIPLARVGEGSVKQNTTFVAVHDVSGDIYGYTSLARELSGRSDLYGIKLAHENFTAPQALSIPGLADEYVRALESTFDESSQLVILGWSLGGMIGFEMAKRLDQRERSVTRLILVDTPYEIGLSDPDAGNEVFIPEKERALLDEFSWLADEESLFPDGASVEDMWYAIRQRLDAQAQERLAAELHRRFPLMARVIPHLSSLSPLEFVCYINRFRSVLQAGQNHRPTGTTAAPIELLTAIRSQNFDPRWSTHTLASFQRRSLDGDHFSILDRRSIRATADAVVSSTTE